jgi:hypothetical protein
VSVNQRKSREQQFACVVHDRVSQLCAPAKRYSMSPDASVNWRELTFHLHQALLLARGVMTAKDLLREDAKP